MELLDKRKTSMEDLEEQPPHKKVATDGPSGPVSTSSSSSPMQEEPVAATSLGDSDAGPSSYSGQISHDSRSGSRQSRGNGDSRASKISPLLPQIWKDDLKSGQLMVSLFGLFGEDILSFIPAPEMSLFL